MTLPCWNVYCNFDLWSKISSKVSLLHRFNDSFIIPSSNGSCIDSSVLGEQPPATVWHHHRGHLGRPLEPNCPDPPAEQLEVHAGSEEHSPGSGGYEPRAPQGIIYTNILQIFFCKTVLLPYPLVSIFLEKSVCQIKNFYIIFSVFLTDIYSIIYTNISQIFLVNCYFLLYPLVSICFRKRAFIR